MCRIGLIVEYSRMKVHSSSRGCEIVPFFLFVTWTLMMCLSIQCRTHRVMLSLWVCRVRPTFCSAFANLRLGVPVGQHSAVSLELTRRSQDEEMISMPMCLPNSQDDDSMMMYLSKSQDDYIMPMCLSNSQSDAVIMGLPC
jgi:hypothetical protein